MTSQEKHAEILLVNSFDYDYHMQERGVPCFGMSRAKGILYTDGRQEIVIDQEYFLKNGISEEWLPAIVVHELSELNDKRPDAHYHAVISEYTYVLECFGLDALTQYHRQLVQMYKGIDTDRNTAFEMILSGT